MRPHFLKIQAFGPFADKVELDFSKLKEGCLFLIHGPTGAGKTSILDAICYALYGESSGNLRKGRFLRSDFASPDLPTEVQFDFQIGEKLYRVVRSPEQELSKKRGEGLKKVGAKAVLWDRTAAKDENDEGEVLEHKTRELNEKIEMLLGFKAHQFRQVILIPQGQFYRFLLADVGEKRELLESLFETERYQIIERALKEKAKELIKEVETLKEEQGYLEKDIEQIIEAEKVEKKDIDELIADFVKDLEALKINIKRQADKLSELREIDSKHQEKHRTLKEYQTAKIAFDDLAKKKELISSKQDILTTAKKAERLVPELKTLLELRERRAILSDDVSQKEAIKADLTQKLVSIADEITAHQQKEEELDKLKNELETLKPLRKLLSEYQVQEKEKITLAKSLKEKQKALGKHKDTIALKEQELHRLSERQEEYLQLKLASTLEDGKPCPVCGSCKHPEPYQSKVVIEQQTGATQEDLSRELNSLRGAEQEFIKAESVLGEKLSAAEETLQNYAEQLKVLSEDLRDLNNFDKYVSELKQKEEDFNKRTKELNEKHTVSKERLLKEESALEAFKKQLEELSEQLTKKETSFKVVLAKSSFKDEASLKEFALSEEQIKALEEEINTFFAKLQSAGDHLKRTKGNSPTEELAPPDSFQSEIKEQELRLRELTRREGQLGELKDRLCQIKLRKQELAKANELLSEEYETVGTLAQIASGEGANLYRLSFHSYILGALLDDVVLAANQRLSRMSSNRFYLIRQQRAEDRRSKAGLNFDVFDEYTGTVRPASSLSGGESFLASLALAFGLADVVQAYAGGKRMEMIFIDEGFGSLDNEALDLAFKTLQDLQHSGRIVGLISHVSELKERVSDCLLVHKGRAGSSASFSLRDL